MSSRTRIARPASRSPASKISVADQFHQLVWRYWGLSKTACPKIQDICEMKNFQKLKKTTVRPIHQNPSDALADSRDEDERRRHQEKTSGLGETKRKTKTLRIDVDEIIPPARIATGTQIPKGYRETLSSKISSWSLATPPLPPGRFYVFPNGTPDCRPAPDGVDSQLRFPLLTNSFCCKLIKITSPQGVY